MDRLIKNRSIELANKIYDARKSAALEFLKYEKHFLKRKCPICFNDKGRSTKIFGYQCKECDHCGLLYVELLPNSKHLNLFYNDHRISGMNHELWQRDRSIEFDQKYSTIKSLSHSGKIIELGSGPGQFVSFLNQKGLDAIGYEIDSNACKEAKKNGIFVKNIDIESDNFEYESGDILLLYEIIEHVLNPKKVLKNVYKAIKKNGFLIITTPNVRGADNYNIPPDTNGRFLASALFPPYHINAFSIYTLYHLLLEIGFSIRKIETPGKLDIEMLDLHTECFKDINFISDEQKRILYNNFQTILSSALGSGHMQIIVQK